MTKNVNLFLKGIIIGLGKIIPGVSGAMLAITLGVYEQGINAISHFFKEFKNNFKFLLYLGLGICLGIIIGSKIVLFFLNRFYIQTMFLFIGMIIGGLRRVTGVIREHSFDLKKALFAMLICILLIILSFGDFNANNGTLNYSANYVLIMVVCGMIDASATVIPGISGTALLMLIGYYDVIITTYSNVLHMDQIVPNLFTLIPYALGMIIGILLIARLMDYLFSNHKLLTYYMILGFAISSIFLLTAQTINNFYNYHSLIISIIALITGGYISIILDKR